MKIQIIIGSVRPGRVGPQVAKWIAENLPEPADTEYEVVDIASWNLPFLDEPGLPSQGNYKQDHTIEWSNKIKEADGFVFLTPEYNAGYAPALKNAIDYLYAEWTNKPVMVASYGVGGGTTASAQLYQVAERLKMRITETSPAISIAGSVREDNGQIKDADIFFGSYMPVIKAAGKELLDLVQAPEEAKV